MSTRRIREEIEGLIDFLVEQELVLDSNRISDDGTHLGWHSYTNAPLIRDFHRFTNIGDYRHWLEHRHYTALLGDGAMLQINYTFDGGEIIKHRLAYVPPPTALDAELLATLPVLDVLDLALADDLHAVTMASPVRFDFDDRAATETHPHSHLTINSTNCRIPCLAPLQVGHFVQFVFQNFYPEMWADHEYLASFDRAGLRPPSVTPDQAGGLHINWRSPLPASVRG